MWHNVWIGIHFFADNYQAVLTSFVEKTVLSSLTDFTSLSKSTNCICFDLFLVSLFCTVDLFVCDLSTCLCSNQYHFLDYFSFIISFEVSIDLPTLYSFQSGLAILVALDFCMTFGISLLISYQKM